MAMPNKKGVLALGFIAVCLAIPFGITYYVSTEAFKDRFARFRGPMPKAPENASLIKSRTIKDQILLVKGERISVHNTSLVYKGIKGDQVMVDLFLEELDPEHAYLQTFSRNLDNKEIVRFGDVAYKIRSINKNTLVLNIYRTMGAQ